LPRVKVADLVEVRAKEPDAKKLETLGRYVREAVSRGHKPWSAAYKFKSVYGAEPPRQWMYDAIREATRAAQSSLPGV
jgi:hypothetical protein